MCSSLVRARKCHILKDVNIAPIACETDWFQHSSLFFNITPRASFLVLGEFEIVLVFWNEPLCERVVI